MTTTIASISGSAAPVCCSIVSIIIIIVSATRVCVSNSVFSFSRSSTRAVQFQRSVCVSAATSTGSSFSFQRTPCNSFSFSVGNSNSIYATASVSSISVSHRSMRRTAPISTPAFSDTVNGYCPTGEGEDRRHPRPSDHPSREQTEFQSSSSVSACSSAAVSTSFGFSVQHAAYSTAAQLQRQRQHRCAPVLSSDPSSASAATTPAPQHWYSTTATISASAFSVHLRFVNRFGVVQATAATVSTSTFNISNDRRTYQRKLQHSATRSYACGAAGDSAVDFRLCSSNGVGVSSICTVVTAPTVAAL